METRRYPGTCDELVRIWYLPSERGVGRQGGGTQQETVISPKDQIDPFSGAGEERGTDG